MEVLSGITQKYRHINSDDFGRYFVLRIEDQEKNIRTKDRHVIGLEIAKIRIPSILMDGITYV